MLALTIDTFDNSPQIAEDPPTEPPLGIDSNSTLLTGEAIGGERDMFVELISGEAGDELRLDTGEVEQPNLLNFAAGTGTTGVRKVTWDGPDGDATTLDVEGLGDGVSGIDLTAEGDRFEFFADADLDGVTGTITVYEFGTGNPSFATVGIPNTSDSGVIPVDAEPIGLLFSSFSDPSVLQNVGAIEFEITGTAAADGQVDEIRVVGPELLINKTVTDLNGGDVEPGDLLLYNITLTNVGDALATGITISDDYDQLFVDSVSMITMDGVDNGDEINWNDLDDLAADGGNVTVMYVATLSDDFPLGSTDVMNTATGDSNETDPVEDDETVTVVVSGAPALEIDKSVMDINGGIVEPGDMLLYSVTLTNTGDAPATGITIVDDYDQLFIDSISMITMGGVDDGDEINWDSLDDLTANGGNVTVMYVATLTDNFPVGTTNVINVATGDSNETDPIDDDVIVPVVVSGDPVLDILKTVDDLNGGIVEPGDQLLYTITLTNIGDAPAIGVTIVDNYDELFIDSNSNITMNGVDSGDVIAWNDLDDLAANGGSVQVTYVATLIDNFPVGVTLVENTAVGDAINTEPDADDEVVTVVVGGNPLLDIDKEFEDLNGGIVEPGDALLYTITLTNIGDAPATGVTIVDDYDELFVDSISNITMNGVDSGDVIAWNNLDDLAANGDSVQVMYVATLIDNFPVGTTNVINVATGDSIETDPIDDDVTVPVVVSGDPELQIIKSVDDLNGGIVEPGDPLLYTITLTNIGDAPATGVTIVDNYDELFVDSISNITMNGVDSGDVIAWNDLDDLAANGGSVQVMYVATLIDNFPVGVTLVENTAVGDAIDTEPDADDEVVTVVVGGNAFLDIDKEFEDLNGGIVEPGDPLLYTITLTNIGDAPATGVTIVDDYDNIFVDSISNITMNGVDSGDVIAWNNLDDLAANGDSVQVMYIATLIDNFPVGVTEVDNTAVGDSIETDPVEVDETVTVIVEAQLAGLGDFVWHDLNANGIQDPGEPGIPGATVKLLNADTGAELDQTTTDGSGFYQFIELDPDLDYKVMFVLPNGFTQVSPFQAGVNSAIDSDADPNNGLMSDVVDLDPGEFDPTIDAGFYNLASLGDFVWEDLNENGIQDAGEPGVEGVTVTLTGTDGAGNPVVDVTTTDANGLYLFDNLVPGDYKVTFSDLPPGFVFTAPNQGGNDGLDSDADPDNGMTPFVDLESGEQNLTLDAGIVEEDVLDPAKISGKVFVDKHKDGYFNEYWDKELEGVKIILSLQDTGEVIAEDYTDEWGRYHFDGLIPGVAYKITQLQPHEFKDGPNIPGWSINEADVGVVEFEKNVVDDMFTNIVLESGECAEGFDFAEHYYSKRHFTSRYSHHSSSGGFSSVGHSSGGYASAGYSSTGHSSGGYSFAGYSSGDHSSGGYSSGGYSSAGHSNGDHSGSKQTYLSSATHTNTSAGSQSEASAADSVWTSYGSSWSSSGSGSKSNFFSRFSFKRW